MATRPQRITTDPDWYEPFKIALGYRIGDLLVLSGQAAITPDGEIVGAGDFDAQAEQVFRNLEHVLGLAGASLRGRRQGHDLPHRHGATSRRSSSCASAGSRRPTRRTRSSRSRALALPELMIEIEAMAVVPG